MALCALTLSLATLVCSLSVFVSPGKGNVLIRPVPSSPSDGAPAKTGLSRITPESDETHINQGVALDLLLPLVSPCNA
ncbi:unnamed protein product [Porites evermanni]|uniref:Secreted protein n=1 Tax=Porites evermanni TaxID=104178 RepID=A0ABN8MKM4_9CNID|nr:unnamed protein product [Porites evermanni]